MKAPERACRFRLDLQADDFESLCRALYNIADQMERREMTTGASGGYDSGYSYELKEGTEPSHDEYFDRLTAYLAEKRATVQPPASHDIAGATVSAEEGAK